MLAAGCALRDGGEVRLIDLSTGKFTLLKLFGRGAVRSLAFTADGAFLATVADYSNITVWDTKTGKTVTTLLSQGGNPDRVAFGAQEKTLVRDKSVSVEVWDRATRKRLKWFKPPQQQFHTSSCLITPDGKTCFESGVRIDNKKGAVRGGLVRVWDVDTGKQRGTLEGHKGAVWSLALSPDSKVLATGAEDTVRLWDVETLKCFAVLEGHTGQVRSLAFSGDGRVLASGSGDRTLKVWDVPALKRGK